MSRKPARKDEAVASNISSTSLLGDAGGKVAGMAGAAASAVSAAAAGFAAGVSSVANAAAEMVPIFFRVPESHRRALKALAALENRTMDSLMHEALQALFEKRHLKLPHK